MPREAVLVSQHNDNDDNDVFVLYNVGGTLTRTLYLWQSNWWTLTRLTLTTLLPTLFVAVFLLLVGDTMFETYAEGTGLPYYTLEGQYYSNTSFSDANADADADDNVPWTNSNTSVPSMESNYIHNDTIGYYTTNYTGMQNNNATMIPTATTSATTTAGATPWQVQDKKALSLTHEWMEQTPWIFVWMILFGTASLLAQAMLVQTTAEFHVQEQQEQQQQSAVNVLEVSSFPLDTLRRVLWLLPRMKLVWCTALLVVLPTLTILGLLGVALMALVVMNAMITEWIRYITALLVLVWTCVLIWILVPPGILMVPMILLSSEDRDDNNHDNDDNDDDETTSVIGDVMEVLTQARDLAQGHHGSILASFLPLLTVATTLALALSWSLVQCVQALAHALAVHRQVYLRTNQEEWIFVLMVGLCALLFIPLLVSLPLVSIHQTVLYINLRVQREGYNRVNLVEDLVSALVAHDDDDDHDDDGGDDDDNYHSRNRTAIALELSTRVNAHATETSQRPPLLLGANDTSTTSLPYDPLRARHPIV